jgi:hypothetical protein
MNQNIFCSKCHRIPSQCCCSSAKELTDEEIDELANKYLYVLNDIPYANDIKDFSRAILKKASEG